MTSPNPNQFLRLMVERCVRAFIAASVSTIGAGLVNPTLTADGLRILAIGAGAAGISAVMSIISQWIGDPQQHQLHAGAGPLMIGTKAKPRTEVSAVITRADGTTIDLGVIARTRPRWTRLLRKAR